MITGGAIAGVAGAAVSMDRCLRYDATRPGDTHACVSSRPGRPQIGVPLLIGAGVLIVAGIVIIATEGHQNGAPSHPVPPPEVHRDESGYDTLK